MTTSIEEQGTFEYGFTLVQRDGVTPVERADLDTLTMTLYDQNTRNVINSRSAVDVLTHPDASFHATNGEGTFLFRSADNPINNDTLAYETHIALFKATWDGGENTKNWQVEIKVRNMVRVPG